MTKSFSFCTNDLDPTSYTTLCGERKRSKSRGLYGFKSRLESDTGLWSDRDAHDKAKRARSVVTISNSIILINNELMSYIFLSRMI